MAKRIFVVQRHDASHLHWDFRLEMRGTLKSWAIPKEPPTKKGVKRLAVPVANHALSYAKFEGVIPEGQYGAGKVKIWDKGTYELMEGSIAKGKMEIELHGKKMKGKYVMVQPKSESFKKGWLLFKA